jgi:hypothetical protein
MFRKEETMSISRVLVSLVAVIFLVTVMAAGHAAGEKELYIISPLDGATVSNPVTIRFGLKGMGVAPAGVDKPMTGHHHLLIDVEGLPPMNMPVPADANHKHFGGGQTEATIELSPGKHTLQLLLGDMGHVPHDPPVVSEKITIMVK